MTHFSALPHAQRFLQEMSQHFRHVLPIANRIRVRIDEARKVQENIPGNETKDILRLSMIHPIS